MDSEAHPGSFWIEEINGKVDAPVRKKRKYVKKKKEYIGWGSTSLIRFLESIGRDTSNKISQSEVTNIINEYVKQNNLFHPTKKKRIECDERLHLLFGRKTISRLKINDLLEVHYADNCDESSDDILFDSEDDENASATCETPKATPLERKSQLRKAVIEKPKSCFAAIIPFNIKLVYLKRSLVQELLKDPETFETKVAGSFIRVKSDPNDYLQKNSHLLLQVTGIKKNSGVDGEIHLQASGFIKDISINMLSDDNFSEEECKDLHRRIKDGLLKRPMIVDMEQKARVLHEDMTKHWLTRELIILQHLIDRSNERGWRRELAEYLDKREKLQSPDEQERLLREIPQVIAEDLESEPETPDVPDKKVENDLHELWDWQPTCTKASLVTKVPEAITNGSVGKAMKLNVDLVRQESSSPKTILSPSRPSEVPLFNVAVNSISRDSAGEHQWSGMPVQPQPEQQTDIAYENIGISQPVESNEVKISRGLLDKQVQPSPSLDQIIELIDDVPQPAKSNEVRISQGLPDKQVQPSLPPVQFIDLSYGVSWPPKSNEGKISLRLPDKQVQPFPPLVQTIGLNNVLSQPAKSNEVRICQGLPDRQVQPSLPPVQFLDLSYGVSQPPKSNEGKISPRLPDKQVQPFPPLVQTIGLNNGLSQPAKSNEVRICQGLPDRQVQPSLPPVQFLDLSYVVSQPPKSNEGKISPRLPDKQVQPFPPLVQTIGLNNGLSQPAKSDEANISPRQPDKQVQPSLLPLQVIELRDGLFQPAKSNEAMISQGPPVNQVRLSPPPAQIIELSDDEEVEAAKEEPRTTNQVTAEQLNTLMWHYRDPQGNVQGPFSVTSLKRWSDACYFPPDFKVWKSGQRPDQAVLLLVILAQFFPRVSNFM